MKLFKTIALLIVGVIACASPADAAVLPFSGDFNATFDSPTQGIANFSGSWSFDFDDSVVTGTGFEFFVVNLTSLTLSPNPIGATTFNTSNASAEVDYEDGTMLSVFIAENTAGLSSVVDDFQVDYDGGTALVTSVGVSVGSQSGMDVNNNGLAGAMSGSFTIPEPATLGLLGIGGLVLLKRRRVS